MPQKNILFISYDGMTDPLGQSQVLPYLKGLAQHDYKIFLISCEKNDVFLKNKLVIDQIVFEAGISWYPITYTKSPPILSTVYDLFKIRRLAKQIHKQYTLHMVHTRAGVPTLVGLWLKNKYGIKFLHDVREFYADSRVDGNMWNLKNPLYKTVYRYFKKQEAKQIKASDGIVCLTYAAEKIIKTLPEYNNTPLQVIPCSADLSLFDTKNIEKDKLAALKNQLGFFENDFIISYLGSIGGWYLTNEMMRLCKVLADNISNAKFLFISPHKHEVIIEAAAQQGLAANKIVVKQAARQEVPILLATSKLSIFFIKPCFSKQSSSPTKHGEIMAMGLPIITNSGVGDVASIVEKYDGGYIVNEFTDEAYLQIAKKIAGGLKFNTDEIKRGATEFYSLQNAIEKYKTLYQAILQ
jgi:glycosyltransferase involved in cell wall biosynthesis